MDPDRDGRAWRVLRLDALLRIVITGVVFATVLSGQVQHSGAAVWTNAGFHYFAPSWTLLGWVVFGPRPRITWRVVMWAFAWPLLWIGHTFAHGAVSGWYPYPFLNVGALGFATVLRNVSLVLLAALVVAVVLKVLDRLPTLRE